MLGWHGWHVPDLFSSIGEASGPAANVFNAPASPVIRKGRGGPAIQARMLQPAGIAIHHALRFLVLRALSDAPLVLRLVPAELSFVARDVPPGRWHDADLCWGGTGGTSPIYFHIGSPREATGWQHFSMRWHARHQEGAWWNCDSSPYASTGRNRDSPRPLVLGTPIRCPKTSSSIVPAGLRRCQGRATPQTVTLSSGKNLDEFGLGPLRLARSHCPAAELAQTAEFNSLSGFRAQIILGPVSSCFLLFFVTIVTVCCPIIKGSK